MGMVMAVYGYDQAAFYEGWARVELGLGSVKVMSIGAKLMTRNT